jgi:hypothetical protein
LFGSIEPASRLNGMPWFSLRPVFRVRSDGKQTPIDLILILRKSCDLNIVAMGGTGPVVVKDQIVCREIFEQPHTIGFTATLRMSGHSFRSLVDGAPQRSPELRYIASRVSIASH